MLIEAAPRDAPWQAVARTVFWGRDVTLDVWRKQVLAGHAAYLPDSVAKMSTWHFVRFLGRAVFEAQWPRVRQFLPDSHPGVARLDVAWSVATSGALNRRPETSLR